MRPDGLVEPVQSLAEAGAEVDPEGIVLALEPAAARGRGPTRPSDRWSSVVASLAVRPGWRNVLAATSRPSRTRSVRTARAASVVQPSSLASVGSPSSASRWSSIQSDVPAGPLDRETGVAQVRPVRPIDPERRPEAHRRAHARTVARNRKTGIPAAYASAMMSGQRRATAPRRRTGAVRRRRPCSGTGRPSGGRREARAARA